MFCDRLVSIPHTSIESHADQDILKNAQVPSKANSQKIHATIAYKELLANVRHWDTVGRRQIDQCKILPLLDRTSEFLP